MSRILQVVLKGKSNQPYRFIPKPIFVTFEKIPAVYIFTTKEDKDNQRACYIGETDNLRDIYNKHFNGTPNPLFGGNIIDYIAFKEVPNEDERKKIVKDISAANKTIGSS